MKTTFPKINQNDHKWHLVDAKGQVLGRLASEIARTLTGKAKRTYAPHMDGGDFVVVINAEHIRITGNNKPTQKIDFRHSGYPGGETMIPYGEFLKKNPQRAIQLAVSGMLPKNKLRPLQMRRLKIYRKSVHPHQGQFVQPAQTSAPEVK